MTVSKAERGHALRRGERDWSTAPAKARGVALAAHAPTGDALSLLVRECLQQIAANAPGLLDDDDPEWVHQMRIGTRRLRSCLALVAHLRAASAALDFARAEVKWLAGVLGSARDWDVFVARDAAAARRLVRAGRDDGGRAEAARARARSRAAAPHGPRRATRSGRRASTALLLAGGLLCATPRFGTEPPARRRGSPMRSSGRADGFRTRAARRAATASSTRRAGALAHGSPEERHAARIAAKRLRYVAEFFAPLFSRKRAKAYLKALTALQDVLGRLNDAATALAIAERVGRARAGRRHRRGSRLGRRAGGRARAGSRRGMASFCATRSRSGDRPRFPQLRTSPGWPANASCSAGVRRSRA